MTYLSERRKVWLSLILWHCPIIKALTALPSVESHCCLGNHSRSIGTCSRVGIVQNFCTQVWTKSIKFLYFWDITYAENTVEAWTEHVLGRVKCLCKNKQVIYTFFILKTSRFLSIRYIFKSSIQKISNFGWARGAHVAKFRRRKKKINKFDFLFFIWRNLPYTSKNNC